MENEEGTWEEQELKRIENGDYEQLRSDLNKIDREEQY